MDREPCNGCGAKNWYAMRTVFEKGVFVDSCSECSSIRTSTNYDVYFKVPYWEQNISSAPVFIESRQQKAQLLKKHGLREAGDRVRGSNGFDGISHRAAERSLNKKEK